MTWHDPVSPHNLDAERSVLGSILVENERLDEVLDILTPEDFYRAAHRRIFSALRTLHERRIAMDFVTLKEELNRSGDLDECGGPTYIAGLADGVPRGVNIPHYAAIVQEKSQRRRLIHACSKAIADAHESDLTVHELVTRTEHDVLGVGQRTAGSDWISADVWTHETYAHLEQLASDPRTVTGVSTGFRDLDGMTRGLQPGDLIIVGARPSMGKTALVTQIALTAARHRTVGLFSVEMSKEALGIRAFALEGRINNMRLMTGRLKPEDYGRLAHALGELSGLRLAIDDSAVLTPTQLRAKARRLKARCGLSALFVDYLQILDGASGRGRAENRTIELAHMSRGLKQLAKELEVPVVVLSQLSRDVEKRSNDDKRPRLSDLRESGAIEQDADLVLLLHRPEYYQETPRPEDVGRAEVIIAKQRNGPTGIVELKFTREYTRFDDWTDNGGF